LLVRKRFLLGLETSWQGSNTLTARDSRLEPLAHEQVPVPEIFVEGKPTLVLDKRTKRRGKKEAVEENLSAAEFMKDLARTIYGPRKLIKLVLTHEGNYPITFMTSDLQSVLKRIQIKHPGAQLMAGAAISTYRQKGDGCVSTLLLATSLLIGCKRLLAGKMHANVIIDGLLLAFQRVNRTAPKLAIRSHETRLAAVQRAVRNSLGGKLSPEDRDVIARLLFRAIEIVGLTNLDETDAEAIFDTKKATGGSLAESELVQGVVLTPEIPHDRMPRIVRGARIALIQGELRIPEKKVTRYQDYSFRFDTPEDLSGFYKSKKEFLEALASKIIEAGANVILVSGGVDDHLFEYFANRDILVIRRFSEIEFERVSRIIGGARIKNPLTMTKDDLAFVDLVEERKVGKEKLIFMTGCRAPKSVDIILRGSINWSLDDIERVMKGAIKSAIAVAKDPTMVWGGGAFEQELAKDLYKYAGTLPDVRQLAVSVAAEAFESLPATLGETAGMKAVDVTAELRHRHSKGDRSAGIDVTNGKIAKMSKLDVQDSLDIKVQMIKGAFETAATLLRIDDLIIGPELPHAERAYLERIKGTSREAQKKKGLLLA
jgi:chaperonin GroEL (HSP60 family)